MKKKQSIIAISLFTIFTAHAGAAQIGSNSNGYDWRKASRAERAIDSAIKY